MAKVKFKSLLSGSCGNCYFLGLFSPSAVGPGETCEAAILIDAGASPRRFKKEMLPLGVGFGDINAMLVTHNHQDHVRSIGSWCKMVGFPVWTTNRLFRSVASLYNSGEYFPRVNHHLQEDGWTQIVPGRISVRWFEVPHDAPQTLGYAILLDGYRFVIITDSGRMTDEALGWAKQADTLVIESNYDPQMLANGPYPIELQNRIRNGNGHLSNIECAEVLRKSIHKGLRNIFLCHLSEHNNTPELAHSINSNALYDAWPDEFGRIPRLCPLPRTTSSPLFEL